MHKRRAQPQHLKPGAPNVLIILLDDVGFGQAATFGGEIHTPTLSRLADEGISYNTFHTTVDLLAHARRAAHRPQPPARRQRHDRRTRGGLGRLHRRDPADLGHAGRRCCGTTATRRPRSASGTTRRPTRPPRWARSTAGRPARHGFDYFYGFLAGETSQWEPRLFENTNAIEPPHDEKYHLSEDLADAASPGCASTAPSRPTSRSSCTGRPARRTGRTRSARSGRTSTRASSTTAGTRYRERVFARQKELGWIPADTKLTPRAEPWPAGTAFPRPSAPFQRRLMEIFAGFVEHVDVQAGKLIDELERLGIRDNTIVIYIFGDNGASAEGQNGTISELLAQNGIPNTIEQQLAALDKIGGLDALGGPKTDNMYHAGWAWAGNTPFQHTKLVASHFGGTRNPMVISWPKGIKADKTPRAQFHHVNDIVPTIYEILGIKPPKVVDGFKQDPIDGVSLAYTFTDAKAPTRKKRAVLRQQRQPRHLPRRLGRGHLRSAGAVAARCAGPGRVGFGQGHLGALRHHARTSRRPTIWPRRSRSGWRSCRRLFDEQAKANKVYPLGAGIWLRLHPEDRIKTPYTSWQFDATTTRMPEFTAPGLGRESSTVTIDAELGENASGVLYALGGSGGGLTLYMDKGQLVYEYNMMIIERYIARSANKLPAGKHRIEVTTTLGSAKPLSPADVVVKVGRAGSGAHHGRSAPCRRRSRPARPSMSAWISARRSRSTTSTAGRSRLTGKLRRWKWTQVIGDSFCERTDRKWRCEHGFYSLAFVLDWCRMNIS